MTSERFTQVARVAASHHALFTRTQAAQLEVPPSTLRRWAREGRIEEIEPDVFGLPGFPLTWQRMLLAAVLAGGPDSLASHRAGARVWVYPGAATAGAEILVLGDVRPRGIRAIVHQTRQLSPSERRVVDGIPVTSPERTLLDYAFVTSPEIVEEAVHDALRRGLTTLDRLERHLAAVGRRGRPGTQRLREVLATRRPHIEATGSGLELRFARLARAAAIELVPQYVVRDSTGAFVARVDFAVAGTPVLVEIQSMAFHSSPEELRRDCRRMNRLRTLGYVVLQFTADDINSRPDETIEVVHLALAGERPAAST